MPEQSNEKRWPERIELGRWKDCDQEPVLMVEHFDGADQDQWEQKTYVPADSPCVLSEEEAQIVVNNLAAVENSLSEIQPLYRRLCSFLEGSDRG
ncbi:MAG TPA: hypothetical protein VD761_11885 [Solirubrobacterales bacterium]|nr:hypothetical protein [Solirubrobacterales bacterium]